jgi:SAM-dependent methyltransferase
MLLKYHCSNTLMPAHRQHRPSPLMFEPMNESWAQNTCELAVPHVGQATLAVGTKLPTDMLSCMTAPRQLKNDIWHVDSPSNPKRLSIQGKEYLRFMDLLYIPCSTDLLTPQQIVTINRFREARLHGDVQFQYHRQITRLFSRALDATGPHNILEIGPGKFPLRPQGTNEYLGCDLDAEALDELNRLHLRACFPEELLHAAKPASYSVCIGAFVFQFNVGEDLLRELPRLLRDDGIIVFNVLSKDVAIRTRAAAQLSKFKLATFMVDLKPVFAKNDIIFVIARASNMGRAQLFYETILKNLQSP